MRWSIVYADNSPSAMTEWNGGLLDTYAFDGVLDLTSFRVLELGTLYDNGNGN